MEITKALKTIKINNFLDKPAETTQNIPINSKLQFFKYGSQNTINTLWSKLPKLYNGSELVNYFNNASVLLALQNLESLLYRDGVAALKENFLVGEVLDYSTISDVVLYLKTKIIFNSKKAILWVEETWEYDENNQLQFSYKVFDKTPNSKLTNNEVMHILFNRFGYQPKKNNIIPYQIFKNTYNEYGDLELVNNELFNILDTDLTIYAKDGLLSAPWFFVSAHGSMQDNLKKGVADITERFIKVNPQVSLYDSQPLQLLQGQSQAPLLVQKIDKTISLIKKFGFMKNDSSDFGTKNMHNVEAEQINSDFEDHIEQKANLREIQLLNYFERFWQELNISKIVITGSTEWLKQQAQTALTNQNGVLLNRNVLNSEPEEVNNNGNN
ncbi:hypothetical protein [Mycoplasmopsis felifaucium]|uniref:hypothetical protein n=1 Tax=Mycoplasmopsis felifaucium TaxID=35768 RepID=UPI00068FF323|nr:hypothetical protein [Mycoplasmopsis felifaucium]